MKELQCQQTQHSKSNFWRSWRAWKIMKDCLALAGVSPHLLVGDFIRVQRDDKTFTTVKRGVKRCKEMHPFRSKRHRKRSHVDPLGPAQSPEKESTRRDVKSTGLKGSTAMLMPVKSDMFCKDQSQYVWICLIMYIYIYIYNIIIYIYNMYIKFAYSALQCSLQLYGSHLFKSTADGFLLWHTINAHIGLSTNPNLCWTGTGKSPKHMRICSLRPYFKPILFSCFAMSTFVLTVLGFRDVWNILECRNNCQYLRESERLVTSCALRDQIQEIAWTNLTHLILRRY